MFGDRLYQLSERDVQARLLDPFVRRTVETIAIANFVTTALRVPTDRVLVLSAAAIYALAGAAQTLSRFEIVLRSRNGVQFRLFGETFAATNQGNGNFSGDVIVPADWDIFAQVFFNAAAAANTVEVDVFGMLIPIGNVERS